MLEPLLHLDLVPPNAVDTMSHTDTRIHTVSPPMTVEQYHELIRRFDDMTLKLERIMQLIDELGESLGIPGIERH